MPLTRREIDAELAREAPDRRTGVRARKAGLVDDGPARPLLGVAGARASLSAAGRSLAGAATRSGFAWPRGGGCCAAVGSGRCGCGTCRRRGRRLLLRRLDQRDDVALRDAIAP